MIAYSRGSKRLAGAASLKHRMPAIIRASRGHLVKAQWQSNSLISCRLRVRIPLTNSKTSDPGFASATA